MRVLPDLRGGHGIPAELEFEPRLYWPPSWAGRSHYQRVLWSPSPHQIVELRPADGHLLLFYAFDVLWLDGKDLRQLPLLERKRILKRIIPAQPTPLL